MDSVDNSFFSQSGSKPIAGKVTRTSINIRKVISYRNSFQIMLKASLKEDSGGTTIICRFGLHTFVKFFMYFWFGFIVLFGGIFWIVVVGAHILTGKIPEGEAWMGVLIPPILVVFGIGLLKFGKYLSKDEPGFLKDFLINLLDAKEINSVEHSHSRGRS
ncbi:MAG: hypothetical protein PVH87_18650 [Desulfobacteraceae bacterium]|jgi:hypothetical protein